MVVGMAVGTAYATQPPRPRRRLAVSSHPNYPCRDLTTGVYGRDHAPSSGP